MSKGVMPISKEMFPIFQSWFLMPNPLPSLIPNDFILLETRWDADGRTARITFESERIPETVNKELPEIGLVMYNHRVSEDDYINEFSRLTVYGEFEPGKKESKVLFEKAGEK